MALADPEQMASAVLFATRARSDGFQRAVLSALRTPYVHRDMEAAIGAAGLAFSPQLLDNPDLQKLFEPLLPAFPQNEDQMQVTVDRHRIPAREPLERRPAPVGS